MARGHGCERERPVLGFVLFGEPNSTAHAAMQGSFATPRRALCGEPALPQRAMASGRGLRGKLRAIDRGVPKSRRAAAGRKSEKDPVHRVESAPRVKEEPIVGVCGEVIWWQIAQNELIQRL